MSDDIVRESELNEQHPQADIVGETADQLPVEGTEDQKINERISLIENELNEWREKYLRLAAEFDNYRKRTLKEKIDMIKTASKDLIENMLPIMDDFDRAEEMIDKSVDLQGVKDGYVLIMSKYRAFLATNGVKEIDAKGKEFTTDEHEAVARVAANEESMKGKVVDVVQKGYYLNDTILRFAKVVVAE